MLFVSFLIKKVWPKSSTNFHFKDQTLADLKVLDPCNRMEVTPASVIRLCHRFDKCNPVDLDDILCGVNDFCVMPENQLPTIN